MMDIDAMPRTPGRALTRWFAPLILVLAGVFGIGREPAFGSVVNTRASVSTHVQELIAEVPASVNADDREYPAPGVVFPLRASASVTSTDLNGYLAGFGRGFCEFADPTRVQDPNPQEFALEVGCFSNVALVSYSVGGEATEARDVVFERRDVDSRPGLVHEIESRVFLSGAVVLWTTGSNGPRDALRSELRISVSQDADQSPLFETSLTVVGGDASPVSSGPIRFERVALDELRELGVDEDTLAILDRVQREGTLAILVIPSQEHTYAYSVTLGERSTLTAKLDANLSNAPEGTGVAAVLGRSFTELAALVATALPGVNGDGLQKSINQAASRRSLGLVSSTAPQTLDDSASTPRMCGAMGMLSWAALLAWIPSAWTVRRTGTRRSGPLP